MKERIKELADQAGVRSIYFNEADNVQKFAELIVQECIKLFPQANFYGGGAIQSTIKEHFGVEE